MVPWREVLTERQERPHDNALVSGEIRIIAKIGFNAELKAKRLLPIAIPIPPLFGAAIAAPPESRN